MIPIPTLGAQREFFRFAAEPNFTNAPGEELHLQTPALLRRFSHKGERSVPRGLGKRKRSPDSSHVLLWKTLPKCGFWLFHKTLIKHVINSLELNSIFVNAVKPLKTTVCREVWPGSRPVVTSSMDVAHYTSKPDPEPYYVYNGNTKATTFNATDTTNGLHSLNFSTILTGFSEQMFLACDCKRCYNSQSRKQLQAKAYGNQTAEALAETSHSKLTESCKPQGDHECSNNMKLQMFGHQAMHLRFCQSSGHGSFSSRRLNHDVLSG
ncbi:hypothetical protein MJT46_016369 [Ovis ammon polii x Ovis aries]|nr:hypothetical protein MJT46_016369 [Ovis ammon polii x Ovis aries]